MNQETFARNQTIDRRLQWTAIAFAAAAPTLIEMKLELLWGPAFGQVPTATAAVVTILTARLKTFQYQENWINYRTNRTLLAGQL